jgi:hypothetical protein
MKNTQPPLSNPNGVLIVDVQNFTTFIHDITTWKFQDGYLNLKDKSGNVKVSMLQDTVYLVMSAAVGEIISICKKSNWELPKNISEPMQEAAENLKIINQILQSPVNSCGTVNVTNDESSADDYSDEVPDDYITVGTTVVCFDHPYKMNVEYVLRDEGICKCSWVPFDKNGYYSPGIRYGFYELKDLYIVPNEHDVPKYTTKSS